MKNSAVLFNQIKLAFPPISASMFAKLRKQDHFKETLEYSQLYVIAQRKELYFEKIQYRKDIPAIQFEINNSDIKHSLKCVLPFFQKNLATDYSKDVGVALELKDKDKSKDSEVRIISIIEKSEGGKSSVLFRMTPEVYLYNVLRNEINSKIDGKIEGFLNYKVHYVGKATEQNICKRLTGHVALQDILSTERPFSYKNIPSDEITLLLFEVEDNFVILTDRTKGVDSAVLKTINDYKLPSYKDLAQDAEKLLIKAMNPSYNKVKYRTYPTQKDLINKTIHDYIVYRLFDPITLKYDYGQIQGRMNIELSDTFYVEKV